MGLSGGPKTGVAHAANVLVVDDEALAAEVIARMLRQVGYSVVEAHNAREALSALGAGDRRFDLVITDVVMPETDGRTLGQMIGERYPGLPVLYVSAYPANDVFHRGAPDSLVPFLQKPFSPEPLLIAVRRLITKPVRS
jgi:two-component system, cell cycle sensor histidine kinase and response regulator CckA